MCVGYRPAPACAIPDFVYHPDNLRVNNAKNEGTELIYPSVTGVKSLRSKIPADNESNFKMALQRESQKNISDRLMSALQRDEFVLYVQSIIPLAAHHEGMPFQEIYVRFKEEDDKLLPPGSFFSILEESQLLPHLDRWVVNRLGRWVRSALTIKPDWLIPRSNVNLSGATLADPTFGEYVRLNVDESNLSEGALGFEISWDNATEHRDSLKRLMAELRPLGISFTVADFNGSESSFAMLEDLTPDFVKISFSIVNSVDSDQSNANQFSEISRRCELLAIKTIAEGVEDSKSLARLRLGSVDFAQGFAVSAVLPL